MFIKHLELKNFRNYASFILDFDQKPTIFIGPNGAGKSNILEAVYLLSTSKSPRVDEEIELIKKTEEASTVKGLVEDAGDTELMVTMVGDGDIKRFGKRVSVNGVGRRVVDFIGNLPTVIFWPSDINMITGSPSLRRWHLDLGLVQANQSYKKSLTLYEQVLTNRNRVLKRINEGLSRHDELEYWTNELLKYGQIVFEARKEFFDFINTIENPLGNFQFVYKENVLSVERLAQYKDREVLAMSTLIGPHRDDFEIYLGNRQQAKGNSANTSKVSGTIAYSLTPNASFRDVSKFGSRGEQRMATLAFKMAQLEFLSHVLGKRPILLLDDVFSELDESHRATVANISLMQQTIIATVELENIPQEFLDQAKIIEVKAGRIDS